MEITVKIKSVYGKEMIYPVCAQAQLFSDLTGAKTLTRSAISLIKQLGYAINVQQESVAL